MAEMVLYLAEDPSLVVSNGVVLDGLMSQFLPQTVYHLNLLELQNHPAAGPALTQLSRTGILVTSSVCRVTCT
jgi:hypothetical protein